MIPQDCVSIMDVTELEENLFAASDAKVRLQLQKKCLKFSKGFWCLGANLVAIHSICFFKRFSCGAFYGSCSLIDF